MKIKKNLLHLEVLSFIKSKTPTFLQILRSFLACNFVKNEDQCRCFLVTFTKLFSLELYRNKALANVFSPEFCKIVKNAYFQHNLTPRIVLHKIAIALKFMLYINQKFRPSFQTMLNLRPT